MALGDGTDATAAGMAVVVGATTPASSIDFEITKTRDYLALGYGGVSAPTASKLVKRDAFGRAQFATPFAAADAATRGYVDGVVSAINWASISGKPATFPPSSHSLSSHSGTLGVASLASGVMSGNFGATGNIENNGNLRSSGVRATGVSSWLNVGVDPSGFLGQTSSARRYKQNIEDFEPGGDVDAIRLRVFHWRKWPDLDPDHGVIAEELIEAGYEWLVTYTDDGKPYGVRYEMLALALVPELQQMRRRVAQLEARLDAIEGGDHGQV